MTIEQLAFEAGISVRNIRAHHSRKLLPPPEVRDRVGYYGREHLARLELIQELQQRGFNLKAIEQLLNSAGSSSEDVLGFTRTLLTPFESELPQVVDETELVHSFGNDQKLLDKAKKLGVIVSLGEGRYEVPSPTLLRAAESLAALGVPPKTALGVFEQVSRDADRITEAFVKLFLGSIWEPFERNGRSSEDWPRVRQALEQLRPLATSTVMTVFEQRMTLAAEKAFGKQLGKGGRSKEGRD